MGQGWSQAEDRGVLSPQRLLVPIKALGSSRETGSPEPQPHCPGSHGGSNCPQVILGKLGTEQTEQELLHQSWLCLSLACDPVMISGFGTSAGLQWPRLGMAGTW